MVVTILTLYLIYKIWPYLIKEMTEEYKNFPKDFSGTSTQSANKNSKEICPASMAKLLTAACKKP